VRIAFYRHHDSIFGFLGIFVMPPPADEDLSGLEDSPGTFSRSSARSCRFSFSFSALT